MKRACIVAMTLTLAACAKSPSAVSPVSMTGAFNNLSCAEAQNALANERVNLASLTSRQRSAATADAVGVFLILVPLSSVTGNNVEGELAVSKGRVIALEQRTASC